MLMTDDAGQVESNKIKIILERNYITTTVLYGWEIHDDYKVGVWLFSVSE